MKSEREPQPAGAEPMANFDTWEQERRAVVAAIPPTTPRHADG